LKFFDSEGAPVNPHRLIVLEPLEKGIGGFGFASADNKFRQDLSRIGLHKFKFYRCVVGSQANAEANHRRFKSKA
jgi:hypothetical protein